MSQPITALNPDIQQLVDEGYEVQLRHQHLLVTSVPYVTPDREVRYDGILACPQGNGRPADHTVWFKGLMPCTCEVVPLHLVIHHSNASTLFEDFRVDHYFSSKPRGVDNFPDFFVKMTHYINLLVAQARGIDPDADARTRRVFESREENGPFVYGDSASSRAGIMAISQKLRHSRIAIVGLGGTGSYILDHVAKTHVA